MLVPEYLELWKRRDFNFITECNVNDEIIKHKKLEQLLRLLTDNTSEIIGFGGAGGGGKSFGSAVWITFMCLQYKNVRYCVCRDEHKKLVDYTLPTFYKVFREYGLEINEDWIYNGQYSFIKFPKTGSEIKFIELKYIPSDPLYERHGGGEFTGGWLEEAGEIHEAGFNYIKIRIGRQLNDEYKLKKKLLITLNPKKNWTKDLFWNPYKIGALPDHIKFIPSLATDNPFISKDYIKSLEEITDTVLKQRLYYGNFDYDDEEGSLIPYDKILDLFTNSFVEKTGNRFISSDIAIGNDNFVIIVWDGLVIIDIYYSNNIAKAITERLQDGRVVRTVDYTPIINKFEEYSVKYKIPKSNIVFDADGLGFDVKKYLSSSVAINNNAKAIGTRNMMEFANLKTQLYYKFVDMVNNSEIFIEADVSPTLRERIISEFQMVKSGVMVGEKLRIWSKAEIRAKLGRSPDLSDGIVYRFLFWLTRKK